MDGVIAYGKSSSARVSLYAGEAASGAAGRANVGSCRASIVCIYEASCSEDGESVVGWWWQTAGEYVFTAERRHIVQEYISSPLLVDTLKFDLRVYVVVTSIEPLEVRTDVRPKLEGQFLALALALDFGL